MDEETERYIEFLRSFDDDDDRHSAMFEVFEEFCPDCGSDRGAWRCYCKRDD